MRGTREESGLGFEEILLVLVIVLLALTAGVVPGRTWLEEPLAKVDRSVDVAPASDRATLALVLGEKGVQVAVNGGEAHAVSGDDPCAPDFHSSIELAVRAVAADAVPLAAEIHAAPNVPMCGYVQARVALQALAQAGVVDEKASLALQEVAGD